jgi:hypothetical protein
MGIGKIAAESAYKILTHKQVPALQLVPVFLIDQSNVAKFGVAGWQ